jgi:hypothetical protein
MELAERMQDIRAAVELGRKHPAWFESNMKVFAAIRNVLIPGEKASAAWEAGGFSDAELAAWEASEFEMDSILRHIGAAWRMTVEHPETLEYPSFKPSAEYAAQVQQILLPDEPLAYVMQLEAVLKMANAYCFRDDKEDSASIEEWLMSG